MNKLYLIIVLMITICSCQEKNPLKEVKTEAIDFKLEILRFDRAVFEPTKLDPNAQVSLLRKNYGGFFDIYSSSIMKLGDVKDPTFPQYFKKFSENPDLQDIYGRTKKLYENIDDIQKDLNEGMKHYKYYFPKRLMPKVATCISGFNYPIIATDSVLAISLEMYLGKKFEYYPMLGLPLYKIEKMQKEYIPSDCMLGWAMAEFTDSLVNKDLVSKMVYYGKMYYFLDAMYPDKSDSLKVGYSEKDLNWCEENEANIWAFFIEKKLLYSSNNDDIKTYTSDGPYTSSISKESPSRIGVWVGWQIVKNYMIKNPQVKLEELMNEKDAHKIFLKSMYKPKK